MEEKQSIKERTLTQIVMIVIGVWIFILFSISLGMTGFATYSLYQRFEGDYSWSLQNALIGGALSIPFAILGGRIGRNKKKTQRAVWIGTIAGTIGPLAVLFLLFLIFAFLGCCGFG